MLKKCSCGGPIILVKKRGTKWKHNGIEVELSQELIIPTCECCGEEFLDNELCEKIDLMLDKISKK